MANRKTVEQQIAEAQAKIKQEQNSLKQLQNKQKEQDRKARNHRLCKRHGLIESLLPDTATLTDEQFKDFLEQHIANNHGKKKLAELMKLNAEIATTETSEQAAQGTGSTAPKTTEAGQSGKPTAPAGEKHNNGNTPKNNQHNAVANSAPQGTAQTASAKPKAG